MAVKLGFIGVGGIAQAHLTRLTQNKDAEVVAVCDIVKQKANNVANRVGARPYKDYRHMLANETLDGVYVCVIPAAHDRIELDVVKAGLPFLIEKPVHLDLAVAKRVARGVAKAKLTTSVGYHWRYHKTTARARKFMKDRAPSLVRGRWLGGMPGVMWWRQKRLSGGQAVEQTTHIFDLARYLAGDVKEVFAYASRGHMTDVPKYAVDDSSVVSLKFANGAVGTIQSSCVAGTAGFGRHGLEVLGRDWAFELTPNTLATYEKHVRTEVAESGAAMADEDDAFIHALVTGDASRIRSDYADGLKTLAVTLAANESINTGKAVKVKA